MTSATPRPPSGIASSHSSLPSSPVASLPFIRRLFVTDSASSLSSPVRDADAFHPAAALDIDGMVRTAVAENSLNPASVEAAIRKAVLPRLFALTGLDLARSITDQVVEVTRVGLSRDAS